MAAKPNTTNGARCLECGQPLRGESLEGFCPRCLSGLAFSAGSEPDGSASAVNRNVADYELIEEIGRGNAQIDALQKANVADVLAAALADEG